MPRRSLGGGAPGEPDDAVLGRGVGPQVRGAGPARHARHIDDAAAVGDGTHLVLQAQEGARQVDIDDASPVLELDFRQGYGLRLKDGFFYSAR